MCDGDKIMTSHSNDDDEEQQLYTSIEEQDERRYQHQYEEWNPDAFAYLRAGIAMSPFMSYLCYKMQFLALPYLGLQILSIPLALKLRDHSGWIRWPSAFFVVALLGGIKTSSLLMQFRNDNVAVKGMFYAFTAFWECSMLYTSLAEEIRWIVLESSIIKELFLRYCVQLKSRSLHKCSQEDSGYEHCVISGSIW